MDNALDIHAQPKLNISNCVTIKLTERNYIHWKRQFESFLSGVDLLGFVNGSNPAPLPSIPVPKVAGGFREVPNPDYQQWVRSDQIVQAWLVGSLSEDILSVVLGAHTAQEVWISLGNHFNRVSSSRVFELQRRLQTVLKTNKTMSDYLKEIKGLCDQLNSVSSPVTEKMKVFAALQGLGREYEPIKTSIEGTMDSTLPPTFEDIVPRLQGFDDRLKSYEASQTSVSPHLAFHVSATEPNYSQNNQYSQQAPNFTQYRGRGGSNGCFGYNRGRGYSTRGRGFHQQISAANNTTPGDAVNRPTCQICGRFGHNALKCYRRFDISYQSTDLPSAMAALHVTNDPPSNDQSYNGTEWYPDTSASAHVTSSHQNLQSSQQYLGNDSVMVADGNFLPITHIGSVPLQTAAGSSGILSLKDVLVCPNIAKSLLSVSKLTVDYPCEFTFDCDGVYVKDKLTKQILTQGSRHKDLCVLENSTFSAFYTARQVAASGEVWHKRLGHPSAEILQILSRSQAININKSMTKICSSCQLGKSAKLPFSSSVYVSSRPLERVHCDLWGPSPVCSVQGFRYYAVLVDNFSRFCWFYPMRQKSDFLQIFTMWQSLVEKQLNHKILMFQSDGGGEFTSNKFVAHLSSHGIKQLLSCPHTPQQNGIAERKHRHITELGLSMLFDGKVPQKYWVEAFFTSSFLGNLLPSSTLPNNKSPYEVLFNRKPEYSALRIFGSACYPSLRPYTANKLDPKSLQCVFLGYNEKYKGYRCLHPPTGRVYINRHVLFDEMCYLLLLLTRIFINSLQLL